LVAEKKVALTYEGIRELEEELKLLKVTRRKEIAQKIKEARSQGDLSENAEYDAAKDEQARNEARIVVVEKMLRNAELIDEEESDKDSVSLGSTVTIRDEDSNEYETYTIVGTAETNPAKMRISNESPVGAALLGRKIGETVEINLPDDETIVYKITEIS